jgi:flagellar L-ring protein precursor FlgH
MLSLLLLSVAGGCSQTQLVVKPDPQYAPVDLRADQFKAEPNGSIYQHGRTVQLFEDNKAYRIGDVLSVTLSESTNASKSAETNTDKDDEIDLNALSVFGSLGPSINGNRILNSTLDGEREFSGSGDSAQSNSLTGEIAVTVVDVLPNGNLVVRGEKIAQDRQFAHFLRRRRRYRGVQFPGLAGALFRQPGVSLLGECNEVQENLYIIDFIRVS